MVSEFNLHYIFEKSIIGRVVFDFLAGFVFSNEEVLEVESMSRQCICMGLQTKKDFDRRQ